MWFAFGLGAVLAAPIGMLPFDPGEQLRPFAPLIAAPVEEFGKLAALLITRRLFSLHHRPLALIGCGLAVGVGFACLENYVFGSRHGFEVALSRVDGFMLHASFTGIAAIFIAFSRITPGRRWRNWFLSICIPVILHGVNNLLVPKDKWFGRFEPLLGAMPKSTVTLFGIAIGVITIGIFIVLFIQLRRSISDDQMTKRSLWNAGEKTGAVLLALGVFSITKGFELLLAASTNPPSPGYFVNFVLLAMGLLFVLGGFAILKCGWGRVP